MNHDRITRRVEAAINRAARRHCRQFRLRKGGATLCEFDAVKRLVPTEDLPRAPGEFLAGSLGAGTTATRCELILTRSAWRDLERLAGSVADFQNCVVEEVDAVGNVAAQWRPDSSVPIDVNSPEGASARVYLYSIQGLGL